MSIKTIWLENPPVNAISRGITEHLWTELEDLGDARCVVLRGRGDKAFSAGADIGGFQVEEGADSEHPAGITPLAEFIESLPVPTVAAIHGYCLGGGLEVALACDLRIATPDAQFGFPEVKLGLLPGGGGTQRAPRLISPGRARWLTMSGERIPAGRPPPASPPWNPAMSAPAENARSPVPVTTITLTSSSTDSASKHRVSSRRMPSFIALSTSGRLSVMVAMPPAASYTIVSYVT